MSDEKRTVPAGIVALAVVIGSYVVMRHVVSPPFPANLTNFYMLFILAGVAIYITLDDRRIEDFLGFVSLRSRVPAVWDAARKLALALIPVLVAWNVYSAQKVSYAPPAMLFAPHVTPPQWVVDLRVPQWAASHESWSQADIEEGKGIYEDNCAPCHGKDADGKGPMARAIRYPAPPTNFKEPGTIAQLPLSYVYWRVRDGGIKDKQFRSAMPGWGDELTEEQIWKVIMYTYAKAGVKPRTWE